LYNEYSLKTVHLTRNNIQSYEQGQNTTNDLQNTTQKTTDWATQHAVVNSDAPEGLALHVPLVASAVKNQ
jgi:hypothetical protein